MVYKIFCKYPRFNKREDMVVVVLTEYARKKRAAGYEQHHSYKNKSDNPIGVGKHFGVVACDALDPDKKADNDSLDVNWYDGERIPIKQVLTWLCPPKGTILRCITKPDQPTKIYNIEITGYSARGVCVLSQHVGYKGRSRKRKQATKKAKTSPKPKKTNPKKKTKTDNKATASKRKRKIGTTNENPKLKISDSDDGHSSDDSLPTCPSRAWKRFRRAKLPDIIRDKLVEEVNIRESEICDSTFDKFQWIPFLNRVAREYSYLHKRRYTNDVMHLHREQILVAAVATIMDQLKPLVVKPLEGNRAEIVSACQRMIETAFGLAGLKKQEKKSSAAWIASVIKSGKYTCRECDEYPELMDAKVTSMMDTMIKMGSPTGAYILQDGQQVPSPDALYQLSERRVGRRRATVFQRAVCQCCSVNVCQCSGVGVPA